MTTAYHVILKKCEDGKSPQITAGTISKQTFDQMQKLYQGHVGVKVDENGIKHLRGRK